MPQLNHSLVSLNWRVTFSHKQLSNLSDRAHLKNKGVVGLLKQELSFREDVSFELVTPHLNITLDLNSIPLSKARSVVGEIIKILESLVKPM